MTDRIVWKIIPLVITISFALNFIWEYFHFPLYVHDMDRLLCTTITSFVDVALILGLYGLIGLFYRNSHWILTPRREQYLALLVLGFMIAYTIELRALLNNTWSYSALMPIIPIIDVGLSPIAQMLILPAVTFWLTKKIVEKWPMQT